MTNLSLPIDQDDQSASVKVVRMDHTQTKSQERVMHQGCMPSPCLWVYMQDIPPLQLGAPCIQPDNPCSAIWPGRPKSPICVMSTASNKTACYRVLCTMLTAADRQRLSYSFNA